MLFIRQGATHKVVLGPFVDVGDGFTPETGVALSTADEAEAILHDNGTVVDISGYTWAAIATADGYYHLTLQSGITGTVGHLTIVVQDDSVCLPVKADFTVVEESVYDNMFAASAVGPLTAAAVNTEADTALTDYDPPTRAELTSDISGLDTKLDTIDDFLDTEIAAILADTNELQTDWANGGRLDLILDAILADTNELQGDWANGGRLDLLIDAILADTGELQTDWVNGGRLDLLLDAIKAVTDLLPDAGALDDLATILADTNELQADWANGGRLDLIIDAILADTNELQADWANGGRLDLIIDAILADTNELQSDDIPGVIAALNNLSAAAVNAEVVDALNVDTYAEPAQGAPGATVSLATKIGFLYKAWRNRVTQTATETKIYNDDAATVDHKATVSDDTTTFDKGEIGTGP